MKNVRPILLAALISMIGATAHAQTIFEYWGSGTAGVDFNVSNFGVFGLTPATQSSGSFVYPRGSGASYIYGAGLWFGAVINRGDSSIRTSFAAYSPSDGTGNGWPGEGTVGAHFAPGLVSVARQYDRGTGIPTLPNRERWPFWTTTRLAPRMAFPGIFEPDTTARISGGRYVSPAFVPGVDEQFVARYTDTARARYPMTAPELRAAGLPLGLQITQNIYAWAEAPFDNCVILEYELINIGPDTLDDCYIGQMTDMDLGKFDNDHLSWYQPDTSLRAVAAWTEPEGTAHRLLLCSAIETPLLRGSRLVDNDRRTIYDEQIGLTTAYRIQAEENPIKPADRYFIMASGRRDLDLGAADMRMLQTSGPFRLRPRDTVHFAMLYGVFDAEYPPSPSAAAKIANTVRSLRDLYYFGAPGAVGSTDAIAGGAMIEALPNPASDAAVIRGSLPGTVTAEIEVVDALGRSVLPPRTTELRDGRFATRLDLSGLAGGIYLVTARGGGAVTTVKVEKRGR